MGTELQMRVFSEHFSQLVPRYNYLQLYYKHACNCRESLLLSNHILNAVQCSAEFWWYETLMMDL